MLQVRSVGFEERIHPVSVFNLTVAKSHAYWVGLDRLLVHNTSCSSNDASNAREASNDDALAAMLRERDELNRMIEPLKRTRPQSAETRARLTELLRDRHRVQVRIVRRRAQVEEARLATKNSDNPLPLLLREREEISRVIRNLKRTTPPESEQLSELLDARNRLQMKIARLRRARPNLNDEARPDGDGARQALEAAQRELAEFEARTPNQGEKAEFSKKRTALRKQIAAAQRVYDRSKKILAWEGELENLETRSGATQAEQLALERTRQALLEKLHKERRRAAGVIQARKRRADPERTAAEREYQRRRRRTAAYEADADRPRDFLEQLEEQLAELRRLPESESSRERIEHLAARTEAMRGQVDLRKKVDMLRKRLYDARKRLDELASREQNTSEATRRIAKLEQEFAAARIERMQLNLKERLLAELDQEDLGNLPRGIDETRVRELESELERELAPGTLDEHHLTGLERELGNYEPTGSTLEQLWSELEANLDESEATTLYEARDVDARVNELQQLLQAPPSPARDAGAEPRFQALQRELREERNALEAVHFELVNQVAHIQTTQASSSSGATWQQRLIAIQEEQAQLREQWRARMQARLDRARHQLDTLQRDQRLRDEAAEAELTRVMALLAHELESPVL